VNLTAATAQIETPNETIELIARVLHRSHERMQAQNAPAEARGVLHVAHSFADELAALDPEFDRVQFVKDATEDPFGPQMG
jgi:hypothetical protein